MAIRTEVVTITPDQAEKWLETNTGNRSVRDSTVKFYTMEMKNNRWHLNGEPIIFDEDGVLLDGQHRLWACFNGKVSFTTVIVWGVKRQSFSTIDTGKARTAADTLFAAGYHVRNKSAIAATVRLVLGYRRGSLHNALYGLPNYEIVDFVEREPAIVDWVSSVVVACKGFKGAWGPQIGAVTYIGAAHQEARAREFVERTGSGADLQLRSPILTLRKKMQSGVAGDGRYVTKYHSIDRFNSVALAWNAFVDGKELSLIKMVRETPKIKGQR